MRVKALILWVCIIVLAGCGDNFQFNPASPGEITRGSGPELRLHPNGGSGDYKDMFADPDKWKDARSKISVFQFHHANTLSGYCPTCYTSDGGTNKYEDFVAVDAFRKLTEWGIPISMEMGSLKHHNCENPERDMPGAVRMAIESVDNVKAAGGRVVDISMDEPFMGGMLRLAWNGTDISGCEYSPEKTAQLTLEHWIRPLQAAHPEVRVGLTEAYPTFDIDQLIRNIDALEKAGYQLPFLHLDYDRYSTIREGQDFNSDMRKLQKALHSRGIKFGIVIWGESGISNESWFADAEAMAIMWRNALGNSPDRIIIESWSRAGKTEFPNPAFPGRNIDPRYYPNNLPESKPSMSYLINQMSLFFR